MFTGGALLNGALFALGIRLYISASIIMQLVGAVFPAIARLQQEGDVGRRTNQYTRYLTLVIASFRPCYYLLLYRPILSLIGQGFNVADYGSIVLSSKATFLVTGTVFDGRYDDFSLAW